MSESDELFKEVFEQRNLDLLATDLELNTELQILVKDAEADQEELKTLVWLAMRFPIILERDYTLGVSSLKGHLETLKWFLKNSLKYRLQSRVATLAAKSGQLVVLQLLQ